MGGYKTVDVTDPIDGRVILKNHYWLCKDGDRTKAVFLNNLAQCNKSGHISRMIKYTSDKTGWNIQVVFLPIAYRPAY